MSGTSLDGIDFCEVELEIVGQKWSFKIHKTRTQKYPENWLKILKNAHQLSIKEIKEIDKSYTKFLSEEILKFMTNVNEIDFICSHGHTVLHQPDKKLTYQIGNLLQLSSYLKKTVVCDFRVQDVKLNGQGAPLVPIGDRILFSEYDYCVNIGGFVNVSFEDDNNRKAFDICPANKILNYYAQQLGLDFDDKGEIASTGKMNDTLLQQLNSLRFYDEKPPKSLGVEWLEQEFLPIAENAEIPIEDKLCTICHHIGCQMSKVLTKSFSTVLITGGGAYHDFLINCIKSYAPKLKIIIPKPEIIEFKEALIFGLLGVLKCRGEINVLSSVTGAKKDHSSGVIHK